MDEAQLGARVRIPQQGPDTFQAYLNIPVSALIHLYKEFWVWVEKKVVF